MSEPLIRWQLAGQGDIPYGGGTASEAHLALDERFGPVIRVSDKERLLALSDGPHGAVYRRVAAVLETVGADIEVLGIAYDSTGDAGQCRSSA